MKYRRQHSFIYGQKGERIARLWLLLRGYRIIEKNYKEAQSFGGGEIDIIARPIFPFSISRKNLANGPLKYSWNFKSRPYIFIEVKSRQTLLDGVYAISPQQKNRLMKAARYFLATQEKQQKPKTINRKNRQFSGRFDAIFIAPNAWPKHMKNIWTLTDL